jgi:hypothetical protein
VATWKENSVELYPLFVCLSIVEGDSLRCLSRRIGKGCLVTGGREKCRCEWRGGICFSHTQVRSGPEMGMPIPVVKSAPRSADWSVTEPNDLGTEAEVFGKSSDALQLQEATTAPISHGPEPFLAGGARSEDPAGPPGRHVLRALAQRFANGCKIKLPVATRVPPGRGCGRREGWLQIGRSPRLRSLSNWLRDARYVKV